MDHDVRCPHGLRLPQHLRGEIRRIPDGAYDVSDADEAWCDMAAGHRGPHHWEAQGNAQGIYWVRWSDAAAELVVLTRCRALPPHDPHEDDSCLLFTGHDGPHDHDGGLAATNRE